MLALLRKQTLNYWVISNFGSEIYTIFNFIYASKSFPIRIARASRKTKEMTHIVKKNLPRRTCLIFPLPKNYIHDKWLEDFLFQYNSFNSQYH